MSKNRLSRVAAHVTAFPVRVEGFQCDLELLFCASKKKILFIIIVYPRPAPPTLVGIAPETDE